MFPKSANCWNAVSCKSIRELAIIALPNVNKDICNMDDKPDSTADGHQPRRPDGNCPPHVPGCVVVRLGLSSDPLEMVSKSVPEFSLALVGGSTNSDITIESYQV